MSAQEWVCCGREREIKVRTEFSLDYTHEKKGTFLPFYLFFPRECFWGKVFLL